LVHPAGLPPANSPFEAEDDNNFTTDNLHVGQQAVYKTAADAEMVGCLGFAPSSRRLRAGTSLSKFATQRDTKAELNRRSQACEVLTGTGVRVAKKNPKRMNPAPGHYFDRAGSLPAGWIHLGNGRA
jgi:hypothetical protein